MSLDDHDLFREQLSAYALGALDAEDVSALEAHLLTCDSCRAELAEYRAVSDGLLAALPPRPPSAALPVQRIGPATDTANKSRPGHS